MSWQWIVVVVIEVLALAFLVYKFFPPKRRPKILDKPDVRASDLTRKRRKT